MKALQWLATAILVLAGVALLVEPAHAQGVEKARFAPTRFTVVDQGTAGKPDVVLIPGLASSRSVWDGEAKLLAPNFRLHLVQVNGFAGAPAGANASGEMLPGIVDELHGYIAGANMHPVVVGHSMGGLLALMLAAKYPADARKLVIVDTLPFYSLLFNPAATVETVKPQAEGIRAQMMSIPEAQYNAMQPRMMQAMVKDPEGLKLVTASAISSDRAVVVNAMVEDMETDERPVLASIKTPTLVLYEYDASQPMPDAGKYEEMMKSSYAPMPNVTLVRMEGSRHFIMYDQPAKFDTALEGFLR